MFWLGLVFKPWFWFGFGWFWYRNPQTKTKTMEHGLVWFSNHGFGLVSAGFGTEILKPKPKPWSTVWFGLVLV
jgi:hypothetical protein